MRREKVQEHLPSTGADIYDALVPDVLNNRRIEPQDLFAQCERHLGNLPALFADLENDAFASSVLADRRASFYRNTLIAARRYADSEMSYLGVMGAYLTAIIANRAGTQTELLAEAMHAHDAILTVLSDSMPNDSRVEVLARAAFCPLLIRVPEEMARKARFDFARHMQELAGEEDPAGFVAAMSRAAIQTLEDSPGLNFLMNVYIATTAEPMGLAQAATIAISVEEIIAPEIVRKPHLVRIVTGVMDACSKLFRAKLISESLDDRSMGRDVLNGLRKDPRYRDGDKTNACYALVTIGEELKGVRWDAHPPADTQTQRAFKAIRRNGAGLH